jgi:ADP-ribose pyrophosphatase
MVFKTLSRKIVWSCPWYSVRQDEILLPDGRPGVYNVVQKEAAVWVLPVTREKEVVMIRSYRYTVDDWCWEIPAGSLKAGQNPAEAACSELVEEVGGQAQQLDYLGQSYMANGICDEVGHFFFATGVTLSEPDHEAAEVIEVHLKSITEVLRMARANEIKDAPSALVILLCTDRLEALAGER